MTSLSVPLNQAGASAQQLARTSLLAIIVGLALLMAQPAADAAQPTPEEEAIAGSKRVLSHIEENKEELAENPDRLYAFVDAEIVPQIDVPKVTRLILGSAYAKATEEQRARFARAFQKMLVRTYGNALLEYSGERIEFLPTEREPNATDALVRSRFTPQRGAPIPVHYRVHLVDGKWKIYDIVVDNISLVTNYRGSFSSEIRKNGLDSLIQRLENSG